MKICKVVGNVWATKKETSLNGYKLMLVRPERENLPEGGLAENGEIFVAVDTIGAGVGDIVVVTTGSPARVLRGQTVDAPVDAAIVGIVDQIDLKN